MSKGFEDSRPRMDATEPVKQVFVRGTARPSKMRFRAEITEQLCLVGGNGGGFAFDGEFRGTEQASNFFHGAQDDFPLAQIQKGRRAAAEENGLRPEIGGRQFSIRG